MSSTAVGPNPRDVAAGPEPSGRVAAPEPRGAADCGVAWKSRVRPRVAACSGGGS